MMKQPMKLFLALIAMVLPLRGWAQQTEAQNREADSLKLVQMDQKYAALWTEEQHAQARSADTLAMLTKVEKDIFYYLNLARMNPKAFGESYAKEFDGDEGWEKAYAFDERKDSLLRQLALMEPLPVMKPKKYLIESAECLAIHSGEQGTFGHDRERVGCPPNTGLGECCDYGGCYTGLGIVMHLLIDGGKGNELLAHRRICLEETYTWLGVAVRPHKMFKNVAVLDFSSIPVRFDPSYPFYPEPGQEDE